MICANILAQRPQVSTGRRLVKAFSCSGCVLLLRRLTIVVALTVPTFGRFTIRRFHNNVSEMKKLAARDFEDILQVAFVSFSLTMSQIANTTSSCGQCSIPVFEGLLPEPFNGMLLRLLYRAAGWHALAKLRIHTDLTLDLLEAVTREFGRLMRQFRDKTLGEFDTREFPHETGAQRGGRSSKKKKLNLNTYKFHALGDYVATIRLFGTTDSYSTQVVGSIPLYHCLHRGLISCRGNLHTVSSSGFTG